MMTLKSIGDGVITVDSEGRIKLMNRVAEKLTGWNEAEVIDKPLEEIFHIINEQTRLPVENPANKVLETGQMVTLAHDTVLRSKNGFERSISGSGGPIPDQKGQVLGMILVFRDRTEH